MSFSAAGTGKSYIIGLITRLMRSFAAERVLTNSGRIAPTGGVLLCGTTGVAGFQISGNTLHSALRLPVQRESNFGVLKPFSDQAASAMRGHFQNLLLVVVDEVSMMSPQLLLAMNQRLMEIGPSPGEPFGGFATLLAGDFSQLPPVRAKAIYRDDDPSLWIGPCHLYASYHYGIILKRTFRATDPQFVALLRALREPSTLSKEQLEMLRSRSATHKPELLTLSDAWASAVHLFSTNHDCAMHNLQVRAIARVISEEEERRRNTGLGEEEWSRKARFDRSLFSGRPRATTG